MAGKHAVFSPSAAERWLTCPGSVALCAGQPDVNSTYADEGTKAHELFEALVSGQPFDTKAFPGDMLAYVMQSATEAKALIPDGADFWCEVGLLHSDQVFGTADLVIAEYFDTLTVVDFKYGAGVPVAAVSDHGELNSQLLLYASMAAQKFGDDFEQVRLVILQPRVDAEVQTDVTVPMAIVRQFRQLVDEAVEAASEPNAALKPSPKACRWCKAKAICPALTAQADAIEPVVTDIPTLSPEKVSEFLDKRAQVEDWFQSVYAYAIRMAEAGIAIPGYVLKPKRAFTRWKPGAEKAAEDLHGQRLFERGIITPAQAKKVDPDFVEEWTESTSSGVNLVREKPSISNTKLMF